MKIVIKVGKIMPLVFKANLKDRHVQSVIFSSMLPIDYNMSSIHVSGNQW